MKEEKNYSVELLRILSMICVVSTHVIEFGGISTSVVFLSPKYFLFTGIETLTRYGVPVFILITGYLMSNRTFKYNRLLSVFFQMGIYSVLNVLIAIAFFREYVSLKIIIQTLVPFLFGYYWYMSAYLVLFIFGPVINIFLDKLSKRMFIQIGLMGILLFSIIPTFTTKDIFTMNGGRTAAWMIFFYSIGYYLKKYDTVGKFSNKVLCYVFLLSTGVGYFGNTVLVVLYNNVTQKDMFVTGSLFNAYTSPTVILATISLFLWIMNLNISKNRVVSVLSKHAFSVYLIHASPIWIRGVFNGCLSGVVTSSLYFLILTFLIIVIGVYFVCSLIDTGYMWFYKKLKIDKWIGKISQVIENIVFKLTNILIEIGF